MAAAHACLNGYLAGVWLVELASVVSASALPAAIGDALGMAFSGGPLEPQLLDYLRRKELLLVLDNFEHLISPAALDLLCQILKQAPGVKLLVTSRARLNLAAEWLYDVSGLAYPSNDAHSTGATEAYPAIQLFIQRAQRIRPGFGPDRADAAAVERICRMTEGLPLAIELAASWARALSPAEIAAELGRGMASLGSAARDLPERHRSLAAVFEHSWMLLPVQERAILAQLAIFRDGFDRAAAESVAGATRPMLQALVDRSLLRVSGQERYTLHPLVQQFAGEKLAQQSEEIALEARTHHAQHFATLVSRREHDFHGAHDRQALAWMLEEAGNIRGAWDWGVQQADTGLLEPFLESLLSQIAAQAGDFAGAEAHLQRALTVARTTGNRLDTVKTLIQLSELQVTRGNLAAAERSLREAAALGQEIHAENLLVRVAAGLADLAVAAGRHQEGPI
jgi:predicted ATPase